MAKNTTVKIIKVACRGAFTIGYSKLSEFQGELKSLSIQNYERLKNEIIREGFSFTVHVWIHNGKHFILDGHQRVRTVKRMIEEEGFECPELPCSVVEAESYQQAKRKLLAATSQYGKIENNGLLEYLQETDISPEELLERYDLPNIDLMKFVESNFDQFAKTDIDAMNEAESIQDTQQYIVSVHCEDEPQMQKIFEELKGRGFQCILIT